MPKNNHICLITSCIIPNTKTGPITTFTKEERMIQLATNMNFLLETNIFTEIYVIDPFLNSKENIKKFSSNMQKNGLIKSDNVKYLKFKPNKEKISQIEKRSKEKSLYGL